MKKARRPGRPPATKEDLLKRRIEALTSEHETGFRSLTPQLPLDSPASIPHSNIPIVIPDLTKEDNVARLDRWEGSWAYLCTLAWVRVNKAGQIKPSAFPPSSGKS